MKRRRGLGFAPAEHMRRALEAEGQVARSAKAVIERSRKGDCAGALDSLANMHAWDGRHMAEQTGATGGRSTAFDERVHGAQRAFKKACLR